MLEATQAVATPRPVHEVQTEPVGPIETYELSGLSNSLADTAIGGINVVVDVQRRYPFVWPAAGNITSYMGPQHPLGIDIGLNYGDLSPIVAIARGTVQFAGGSDAEDYGYHVIVDHGEGLTTLYAHFDRLLVVTGQAVGQGDLLGYGGDTGKADGKHLHFEVHFDNTLIDPLRLLPQTVKAAESNRAACGTTPLVLDRGSRTTIDLANLVGNLDRASFVSLVGVDPATAPAAAATALDRTAVVVDSQPSLRGPREDAYELSVHFATDQGDRAFDCLVSIKTPRISSSYYVRAAATPTPTATTSARATVTVTATPAPAAAGTPTVAAVQPAGGSGPAATEEAPPPELKDPAQLEAAALAALLPTVQAALFQATATTEPSSTPTPVPAASATPTSPPAATSTPAPPTATTVPPTKTPTTVPPTATSAPPTATHTAP